jgi:urease accessory protein
MAHCFAAIPRKHCRSLNVTFCSSVETSHLVMTIVEQVTPATSLAPEHMSYRQDTLSLTWEERRRGHGKRQSDSGLSFAISLPGGTVLKENDCLVLESERTVVRIREAPEPVYIVRPKSPREWAFYAYHVGNRHQPVMIGETELIFLQGPAVRSLLEQLQVPYETAERPFTAALANVGHFL